jgi:hypothetical protein
MSNAQGTKKQTLAPQRASALDPRAPLLVQPFKRLVEEGFLLKVNVEFTPSGFTATGVPDSRMIEVANSGLVKDASYPLGKLAAVAEQGNLIPLKGKGKGQKGAGPSGQPLPEKSLCKKDFAKTDAELYARAQAVAKKCTGSTLVGRVRSADLFDGTTTISFKKWWQTADVECRLTALTVTKQRSLITEEEAAALTRMQCPFPGPAEFTVAEEEAAPVVQKTSGATSPKK